MLSSTARAAVAAATHTPSRHLARSLASAAGGDYDVVIVGGGPGGYVAAIKAGQLGLKTACVEGRGRLGGTCLNVGCIPSKAMLHSSHLYEEASKHMKDYGVIVNDVSVDLDAMLKFKEGTVDKLTQGIEGYLFKKNGVDYYKGWGKVTAPGQVEATLEGGEVQKLSTKNVIIATGSEVAPLPPCPVDNEKGRIVDSTGALSLKEVPKKMIVIGGGYIGLEMGSVWGRLGAEVTVVEYLDRIVPAMDTEVSKQFMRTLKGQGMKFKLGTKVTASDVTDSGVTLTVEPSKGGEATTLEADVVLVATGRRPYTTGLGLEEVGVKTDRLGRVEVDDEFKTGVDGIFAIGDVIDGPMLAHKAEEEGIACVENIAGKHGHVNYDVIPGVVYTNPEVATVGKTEDELKEAGVEYGKGVFNFSANSRARCVGESAGMVKVLTDKATDRILGVHIMGPNAGELIAEAVLGMEYGASAEDIARTCHAHPTLSEAVKEACAAAYDKPINA